MLIGNKTVVSVSRDGRSGFLLDFSRDPRAELSRMLASGALQAGPINLPTMTVADQTNGARFWHVRSADILSPFGLFHVLRALIRSGAFFIVGPSAVVIDADGNGPHGENDARYIVCGERTEGPGTCSICDRNTWSDDYVCLDGGEDICADHVWEADSIDEDKGRIGCNRPAPIDADEAADQTEERGPSADDYVMTDARGGGVAVSQAEGRYLDTLDTRDEAEDFIRAEGKRHKFTPDVWFMSDHGNAHLVRGFDWDATKERKRDASGRFI